MNLLPLAPGTSVFYFNPVSKSLPQWRRAARRVRLARKRWPRCDATRGKTDSARCHWARTWADNDRAIGISGETTAIWKATSIPKWSSTVVEGNMYRSCGTRLRSQCAPIYGPVHVFRSVVLLLLIQAAFSGCRELHSLFDAPLSTCTLLTCRLREKRAHRRR